MIRGDSVTCGTSSTGTGALTLAACAAPPGGIDPYQWLTATGLGFANGNAVLTSYTIIEYTDSTFTTAKAFEKGIGTLTLGSSLAGCTLARTTVQSTASAMNTTGLPVYSSPTAFSIGTAANTLIFVGASVCDLDVVDPYYDTGGSGDGVILPASTGSTSTATAGAAGAIANGTDIYIPFWWRVPKLITKCSVKTGSSAATDASNSLNASIYAIGSNGRPGKKLIDFGAFAGTNIFNTIGNFVTATSAGSYLLLGGEYFLGLLPSRTTPAGTASLRGMAWLATGGLSQSTAAIVAATASGDSLSAGLMSDPANLTSYINYTNANGNAPYFGFM